MRKVVLVVLMVLLGGSFARADQLILRNGDRITGKLEKIVGGKVTFTSDMAGTLTIDVADVRTFATDAPVEIHLRSGTILKQKVKAADEGRIAIEGDGVLQPQTLSIGDIAAVNPSPRAPAKWTGNLTGGYTATRGNSRTTSGALDMDLSRRGGKDRVTIKGGYLYGKQEDPDTGMEKKTSDKWYASGKYDRFITDKLYGFVNGRVEQDNIADLDNRTAVGGGLGVQWVESDALNLSTEAGAAWVHEKFGTAGGSNNEMSAQFGYHVDAKLNDHVTFLHDLTVWPAFEDFADYFLTAQAELRASITQTIFASAKAVLDYDRTPAAGANKTDMTYIFGIGVKLF